MKKKQKKVCIKTLPVGRVQDIAETAVLVLVPPTLKKNSEIFSGRLRCPHINWFTTEILEIRWTQLKLWCIPVHFVCLDCPCVEFSGDITAMFGQIEKKIIHRWIQHTSDRRVNFWNPILGFGFPIYVLDTLWAETAKRHRVRICSFQWYTVGLQYFFIWAVRRTPEILPFSL